ncbi:TlpA family protein disulfide reductase [Hyunsoonleella pacifica]|uniref:TlpA family protein disulfide reductase n=1 Tax=Hyunsoonleella pacifica TaxID=1080224 RepID=A0A4V2JAQ7_9FLAO|nr:TlpA disulfide reductase family protein [Hyunsoonleella pacifica]TBN14328.1 TlpA family protein disulfide reductase [Hyunsoonleella pacifica]GGD12824.1 hypothetical protein GCM10011368_13520 [Hyunsoonleella pacifica]
MVKALSILDTPEEVEAQRVFREDFSNSIKSFNQKYQAHYSAIYKERRNVNREQKINEFFGKDSSFLQDVIKMQLLSQQLEDFIVYSDKELALAKETISTTFMQDYLVEINKQTKAKIEGNKSKDGYNVHEIEKSEGDELFDAMLEKFKGKVVYIDFWATWCGPCKSGIKKIVPLKEEMANEDVVFLYVTNQTSPEGTWKNAIANIKGEHYRVSTDEWNYLAQKFNISGIPHYTLVDRKGNVVKPKLRHMDNNSLKKELMEEINK